MSNPTGIEALVCADIAARQELGIRKYGQTVADNPLPLRAWLQHAYEESLDLPIYLRRAIAEIDATAYIVKVVDARDLGPMFPCRLEAGQLLHGRTQAAEAVSRLLDAQKDEILRLRGDVARLEGLLAGTSEKGGA